MKYIYYIIAIVIVFSGLAAYGLFDTRLEISKPYLSVNDRIVSEKEFEKMMERKPGYMTREQFADSIIDKQLLIQEAIKMDIHKEESFRRSVENFYEQSLIKILLDRKLSSLVVDVTNDEISKYESFLENKLVLTKTMYPSLADAQKKTNETVQKIESDFINLSDDLKFIVLTLEKGASSKPKQRGMEGVVMYRLDDTLKKDVSQADQTKEFDIKRVSLFIQDKK
ncbi:MAG: hypothetical protein KKE61_08665, partial [Proteobacteria bacterium]|nr:hypothetical protein [Pseudomonadota bacterium]